MKILKEEIKKCKICEEYLPLGCNPIFVADEKSKIALISQAPGKKVHESSIPWNDKSGDNLRSWLSVSKEEFYDPKLFAIVPMGFCYPGRGKSGDLPPRKECAPQWHNLLFNFMTEIDLILLVGWYAQQYYLQEKTKDNLTETVRNFENYLPKFFPLPHPSPRNNIWLKKNPWFVKSLLPELSSSITQIKISR